MNSTFAKKVEIGFVRVFAFEHFDPIDVTFDCARAIWQCQSSCNGIEFSRQSGDEGSQCGFLAAADCSHPRAEIMAEEVGQDLGEVSDQFLGGLAAAGRTGVARLAAH